MSDSDHRYFFGSHPEMPWKKDKAKNLNNGGDLVLSLIKRAFALWAKECGYDNNVRRPKQEE